MRILGLNPPSIFSKNVARDLLWGCWCKGKRIAGVQFPPLPLLYVGTVLKNEGHKVDIIDAQIEEMSREKLRGIIVNYDIVFLISATMSYNEDADLLTSLKEKKPQLITIVFGAHTTFLPESALTKASVDIIIKKEAEFVIRDLVRELDKRSDSWKKVPGIGYRENGKIIINQDYPYIDNLDELPIPDRAFLPKDVYYYNPIVKYFPWTTALSSRGCPSRCTFCTSPSYYGPVYRARSAENIVEEIVYLKNLGFKEIFYRDELFTVNKKRVFEICDLILKKNIKISWICSIKASTVSYDMLLAMKQAGCRIIRVGVESGVQEILDNVKKDVKIEQTENTFKWARKLKIGTHAHMMLGMPGETVETIKKSFNFIKKIRPDTVTYGIMTPYPGTDIYRSVVQYDSRYGDGTHINASVIHTNASFSRVFCDISAEKLSNYVRTGYRKYYARPGYIINKLLKIRDIDDAKRLVLAGTNVFSFIISEDK